MDSDEYPNPEESPELFAGPMLFLLRRMEKMEFVMDRLIEDGFVSPELLEWANLKSTLKHAERIIRVRERTACPADDVIAAADTIRTEIEALELRLRPLV